ncbi:hypothetical protein GF376_01735 [Candidatus Peregrinibacteria bacterium]|nr:hypothetical protein [Candidatus Peregrinibacteria bacterium]
MKNKQNKFLYAFFGVFAVVVVVVAATMSGSFFQGNLKNLDDINQNDCKVIGSFFSEGLWSGTYQGGANVSPSDFGKTPRQCVEEVGKVRWSELAKKSSPSAGLCYEIKSYYNAGEWTGRADNIYKETGEKCFDVYGWDFWKSISGKKYIDAPTKAECDVIKSYYNQGIWTGNMQYQSEFTGEQCRLEFGVQYWSGPGITEPLDDDNMDSDSSDSSVESKVITPEKDIVEELQPRCNQFFDNVASSQYYEAVEYVRKNAIFGGYENCTFRALDTINRAEIAKVMVEGFGYEINTNGGPHFPDVDENAWYYDLVETAYNRGIVVGYPDGTFRPGSDIVNSEIAKMFVLSSSLSNQLATVDEDNTCDGMDTSEWYNEYYAVLVSNGVVDPADCRPSDAALRGEVAEMFYNYSKN